MTGDLKEVYFEQYCHKCKWVNSDPADDPCDDCLSNPGNIDSHKPIHFEEKEE